MRESLICIGKIGKKGYYFEDTGIQIFSYEELCYYLKRHMICYIHTLPGEDLLVYLRDELGLEKLYKQLIRLTDPEKDQMKYFSALFREGHYFNEDEIRDILDEYRSLMNAPVYRQKKWMGDLLVRSGRSARALESYQEALVEEDLEKNEIGRIYHNIGIAESKLFRFQNAKIAFIKAYQHLGEEKSLFYYYAITALLEGIEAAGEELKEFEDSDMLLDAFEEKFAEYQEDFQYNAVSEIYKKIVFLNENGKEEEAKIKKKRLVRSLQRDFRKEIETSIKNISDKCANKLYYGSWYVIYDITSELECQEIYRDIPIRNAWHI